MTPIIKVRTRKLVEKRIKAGHTQRAFARLNNLSSGYMSQLERGERSPGPEVAKRICEALGAEFDELFYLTNENGKQAAIG